MWKLEKEPESLCPTDAFTSVAARCLQEVAMRIHVLTSREATSKRLIIDEFLQPFLELSRHHRLLFKCAELRVAQTFMAELHKAKSTSDPSLRIPESERMGWMP